MDWTFGPLQAMKDALPRLKATPHGVFVGSVIAADGTAQDPFLLVHRAPVRRRRIGPKTSAAPCGVE